MFTILLRFFCVVIISLLLLFCTTYVVSDEDKRTNKIEASQKTINTKHMTTGFFNSNSLGVYIDSVLLGAQGTYGIAVKNLKTGETYYYNEHRKFAAGSLYKTWILATAYQLIENGELTEGEILSRNADVLNREFGIASESAEMKQGAVTFSVYDAMDKMITISHNYAALLLSDRVNMSNVQDFLQNYDFLESSTGSPPLTTPFDMAKYFEKLYYNELASKEDTEKMLSFYLKQQINQKIPKYIPKGIPIAHKTGEIDEYSHDAGIIYSDAGNYILVVMTESNVRDAADERISEISRVVYDYFHGIAL